MDAPSCAPRDGSTEPNVSATTSSLTVAPTADPRRVRTSDGVVLSAPTGWCLLPPGDAGWTRRVKAAGPSWTVVEKRGRKTFSRGVWAPVETVDAARVALDAERATEAYTKRRAGDAARRGREHASYVDEFAAACASFLRFAPTFAAQQRALAAAVTAHATPVGSGTVARTERIPVERRVEAAVIAWMRHQTTAYDTTPVARVRGARREVRQALAGSSREVLARHRRDEPHPVVTCVLCLALRAAGPGTVGAPDRGGPAAT